MLLTTLNTWITMERDEALRFEVVIVMWMLMMMLRCIVFWLCVSILEELFTSALMMEAVYSSEMLAHDQNSTRCNKQEAIRKVWKILNFLLPPWNQQWNGWKYLICILESPFQIYLYIPSTIFMPDTKWLLSSVITFEISYADRFFKVLFYSLQTEARIVFSKKTRPLTSMSFTTLFS
jgi:hypothetical protein